MRTRGVIVSLASAAALTLLAGAARADGNPCIDDAVQQFLECRGQCKEDFQIAKDACLGRDHDCMEVCRAKREDCRQQTGIDEDLAACNAQLYAAKQNCRQDPANPTGSDNLDHCIDQAQVVAFQCRDAARERWRPELQVCRAEFRACAKACPEVPGNNIDPVQCRIDAKAAYKQCKADCREQLQTQKDLCRNRDHDCVEVCRARRDDCRKPIEDQLNADIEACNAQLASDKQQCQNAFPNDPAGLDQCIDNAQVTAFTCRDDARERARPGFANCRQQFQSCAELCPPAS
jgi:hypothetical protein